MVRTHDGRPLASTQDVGNPRPAPRVAPARSLSLLEFGREIADKVRVQAAR
jgi:hypothetical protein